MSTALENLEDELDCYYLLYVAADLYEIGAVMDRSKSPEGKGFRLKLHEKNPEAPLSPVYINLRVLRSFPELLHQTVRGFMEMEDALGLAYNLVADVPTAATPIVAVFSHITKVPMVTPRETKTHGAGGAAIDGVFQPGQVVLLIDDLITKADSKLEAIRVLESHGLVVKDVMVLVDREQGGVQQLEAAGYRVHVAFKLSTLLKYYLESGRMSQETYHEIMEYLGLH